MHLPTGAAIMAKNRISDHEEAAEMLKAAAHPERLRILDRLATGLLCVSDVEKELGMPQPTVSGHLGVLRRAGLVDRVTEGRRRCYYISDSRVMEIVRIASTKPGRPLDPPKCGI
jgi:ArsR family transcriptional regulator